MRADVVLAILAMAAVTYATRVGGPWLMRRVPMSRRTDAWLRHLPGAVLVSLVAPAIASEGMTGLIGAAVTAGVAIRTRNLLPALIAGVGTVWLLRRIPGWFP